jgi:hypothetical protein
MTTIYRYLEIAHDQDASGEAIPMSFCVFVPTAEIEISCVDNIWIRAVFQTFGCGCMRLDQMSK